MADANAVRLFVALTAPEHVRERIAAAQSELRSAVPEGALSWTNPAQFHLTLKFLGAVRIENLAPMSAVLRGACERSSPFAISARGVGFFPSASRARVVWVGLEAEGTILAQLHSAVEEVSLPFTSEKPEYRFHAHVTIARVRRPGTGLANVLARWSQHPGETEFGSWEVNRVQLMRSQLHPSGARYTVLEEFPLRG